MLASGMGASATSVSQGLRCSRKYQREDGEEDGVGAVHERRAQQHAHGIQVVGHAGHDVAGAIALIEARVLLLFEVTEEVVAHVELDLARDADENPALRVEKDALDQRDGDQQAGEQRIGLRLVLMPLQPSTAHAQHPGKLHRRGIGATQESVPHTYPQR
jgi:hypothetical protein